MGIAIPAGLTDDNDFIGMLNSMLNGLLTRQAPEELWVVHIDNWFDHKWLRFSGNGAVACLPGNGPVALGFPLTRIESVKRAFYQNKLTFPPFSPERVLGQWSFQRKGSEYVEEPLLRLPHGKQRRTSNSNLQKRIEKRGKPTLFVWFSGNTLKNGRGSAMVYIVGSRDSICWFASFIRRDERWSLQMTRGIARDEIFALVANI